MNNSHTLKHLFRASAAALSLTACIAATSAQAAITGDWKIFPTFDNSVTAVADTPDRVYFTGLTQALNSSVTSKSTPENALFYYDKEGDEIVGMSVTNGLSSTAIDRIDYNGERGYLMITYNDYSMDFLLDNGEIHNINALKTATIPGSKTINDITFYPKENMAVVATGFGYVIINDEKFEVAESRNYNYNITSAARFGDRMVLAFNGKAWAAPFSDRRTSITDYAEVTCIPGADFFLDMGKDDKLLVAVQNGSNKRFHVLADPGANIRLVHTRTPNSYIGHSRSKNGWILTQKWSGNFYLTYDDEMKPFTRPEDEAGYHMGSWDAVNFYTVAPRLGLRSFKVDMAANTTTITKEWALPNAPNVYFSRGMAYHPDYGMLINSHGCETLFNTTSLNENMLLSAYRNGIWTPMSASYRNTEQAEVGANPLGIAIDPDDRKYIYTGSNFSGITRTNLEDPKDVLHMTHPSDHTAGLPGYVKMHEDLGWKRLSRFSDPFFDANGVLWSNFLNWDGPFQMWYWLPEDRKASKNPASFRPWKKITVNDFSIASFDRLLPLTAPVNRGIIIAVTNATGHPVLVYDHNNTLDNLTDDKKVIMTDIKDQDGGVVDPYNVHWIHEDQDSGTVWICCDSGIFFFQPRNALKGQIILNRVKIARNDGTTLADYLLNGICVTHIAQDNAGRKWIGTNGGGLVVTSSDGRTVLQEFTTANSGLPSDVIFYSAYNPDNRSMIISTDKGITEFFVAGSASSDSAESSVRAYPNPVAPDYYGWVTIDGLPDNAHVKIMDSEGNLVRELGKAEAGSIQWDVLNIYGKRVRTGVYYILSSSTNGGESNIAKILVMN